MRHAVRVGVGHGFWAGEVRSGEAGMQVQNLLGPYTSTALCRWTLPETRSTIQQVEHGRDLRMLAEFSCGHGHSLACGSGVV